MNFVAVREHIAVTADGRGFSVNEINPARGIAEIRFKKIVDSLDISHICRENDVFFFADFGKHVINRITLADFNLGFFEYNAVRGDMLLPLSFTVSHLTEIVTVPADSALPPEKKMLRAKAITARETRITVTASAVFFCL